MLLLLIILLLVFGGGGLYAGPGLYRQGGWGIGTILLILLIVLAFSGRL